MTTNDKVLDLEHLKKYLKVLGFYLVDGDKNVFSKIYLENKNYEIKVSVSNETNKPIIDWGNKIKVIRSTSSDMSAKESWVVLECVNRLLEKGYKPENIVLEKDWKLGHKGKGFLDIQVLDNLGKSYLMIECKTWGDEFEKEKKNTQDNGGQLFSYFIQERNTEFLCLYASFLEDGEIKYQNEVVIVTEEMKKSENQREAFESWQPQVFEKKGVFDKDSKPYLAEFTGLTKSELKPLSANDGGNIFNNFAEILRRNVVSDKNNAFNKIFNLFLAKIVDEFETKNKEELDFQWREEETNEEVMIRLNDLYKRGMELYLDLKIEAVTEDEINKAIKSFVNKEEVRDLFIRQRLYSGNEFAFKEVFDKKSFDENCLVVKEIVKLLEGYQIKYSTKQQFLGDFFENLLNTGIKQESGQFFTPIPIAQFICKSIPIYEIIEKKNNNREPHFLPYLIDYASGSGHFLTEIMAEVDAIISNIDESWVNSGEKYKQEFKRIKDNFIWAGEYVYGIEKDYRLAKTTKISTFLNGDGDANIIYADGLAHFEKSEEYRGKLKELVKGKDNGQFDILVANPPYSVDGFKNTLEFGKESFDLYPLLTDKSQEIECLFVERAKQLIKEGGVAGIILPTSMFYNGGVYEKTREILLKYFNIRSIVILGDKTFMETTKQTVIVFLERRADNDWLEASENTETFFSSFMEFDCLGIKKVVSEYLEVTHGISFSEYKKALMDIKEGSFSEIFSEYKESYPKESIENLLKIVLEKEKSKILYFTLSYKQQVVVVKVPDDKNKQKEFLGYKFSSTKGKEGIEVFRNKYNNNELTTKLFSETDYNDTEKVNYYIRKSYSQETDNIEIHSSLKEQIRIADLSNLLDFSEPNFSKKVSLSPKLKIKTDFETDRLIGIYPVVDSGSGAPQDRELFKNGKYPFIRAGNISNKDEDNNVIPDEDSMLNDLGVKESNLRKFKAGTILFAKSGKSSQTGNIARLKEDSFVVNHLACLYCDNKLDLDFLYYYLEYYGTPNLIPVDSDYPSINLSIIKKFPIPIIPENQKKKIVSDLRKIEKDNNIKNKKEEKERYLDKIFSKLYEY